MFARLSQFCFTTLIALSVSYVAAADAPKQSAPAEPADMKPMTNGKDLSGWDGDTRLWSFKDGIIRGETTDKNQIKTNTFLIWQGGDVEDFEFRTSFKIDHGNSGIQYRSKHHKDKENAKLPGSKWIVGGYQCEIENTPGKCGFLYNERGDRPNNKREGLKNGLYLCEVGEKVEMDEKGMSHQIERFASKEDLGKTYKKSEWNDYVIIAKGNNVKHYLNGYLVVDFTDNDPKQMLTKGVLALQIHTGKPMVVEFKNPRIKLATK
jgi:hypothetical protein